MVCGRRTDTALVPARVGGRTYDGSVPSDETLRSDAQGGRRPSRAPVYLTIAAFAVALTAVFVAATVARQPVAPPGIDRPGTPDAPRPITVVMRDHAFVPSTLALVPGETVRLTVLNGGLVPHELVLGDPAVQAAWASADAAATPPAPFATPPPASVAPGVSGFRVLLSSGEQTVGTYQVPAAGPLAVVCNLPGHQARGMVASVDLSAGR